MQCVHAAALELFQIDANLRATKWLEKYLTGFH